MTPTKDPGGRRTCSLRPPPPPKSVTTFFQTTQLKTKTNHQLLFPRSPPALKQRKTMPTKTNTPDVVVKKITLRPNQIGHRNQPVQKLKVSNAGNDQKLLVKTLLAMACHNAGTNARPPAHRSCSKTHPTLCRASHGQNKNHAALVCTAPGCNFSGQQETDKSGRRRPVQGTAGKEKKKPLSSMRVGGGRYRGSGQRLDLAVPCVPAPVSLPVHLNPRRGKTRKYTRRPCTTFVMVLLCLATVLMDGVVQAVFAPVDLVALKTAVDSCVSSTGDGSACASSSYGAIGEWDGGTCPE